MKEMKKKEYVAPLEELFEARVERGFQDSIGKDDSKGLTDYNPTESQGMKFS